METLRLRRIQQPSEVERLLEAFVSRGGVLPKDCYQIRATHCCAFKPLKFCVDR
jgi:hypothetical protein